MYTSKSETFLFDQIILKIVNLTENSQFDEKSPFVKKKNTKIKLQMNEFTT